MIVVASNDNESSQVILPGFARFLTIAEVADVEDGVVITSLTVWQFFYEQGDGGEHYRTKNKFRCRVSRIEKRLVKLKEKIW